LGKYEGCTRCLSQFHDSHECANCQPCTCNGKDPKCETCGGWGTFFLEERKPGVWLKPTAVSEKEETL